MSTELVFAVVIIALAVILFGSVLMVGDGAQKGQSLRAVHTE